MVELLTIQEVAETMRLSQSTIRRRVAESRKGARHFRNRSTANTKKDCGGRKTLSCGRKMSRMFPVLKAPASEIDGLKSLTTFYANLA